MTEFEGPDLLVAGAGGGLAGALRAAEQGLSVVVVEASPHFRRGNNTSMSTAMFPGAGTRWQAEAGVEDSPDRFVADIMAKTGGQAEPRLARTLAEVSGPLVEWLADSVGPAVVAGHRFQLSRACRAAVSFDPRTARLPGGRPPGA